MKRTAVFICLAVLAACAAQGGAAKNRAAGKGGGMKTLKVTSPAFAGGGYIPAKYACGGEDVSPALRWEGAPSGTRSFAVIMEDPDAPAGTWVHWVLFDIPASAGGLPGALPKEDVLRDGSRHGLCWGVNEDDFSRIGYYGPCPPPGKPHHYHFTVYALDIAPGLPAGTPKGALLDAMKGHILAQGELVGLYKR